MVSEELLVKFREMLSNKEIARKPHLRFMLVSPKSMLIYDRGSYMYESQNNEFSIRDLDLERGQLLDIFTRIELVINELIRFGIGNSDSAFSSRVEQITDTLDISRKIRFLRKWRIIEGRTAERLDVVMRVRNGLAHHWDAERVPFKKDDLKDQFESFKDDLGFVWKKLLSAYEELLQPTLHKLEKEAENLRAKKSQGS